MEPNSINRTACIYERKSVLRVMFFCVFFFLLYSPSVLSQINGQTEHEVERIAEENDLEATENDYLDIYDYLRELERRPLNLNKATFQELIRLGFLGPLLVERLLFYRRKHGKFRDWEELQRISGLTFDLILRLRRYSEIPGINRDNISARSQTVFLQLLSGSVIQKQKGFQTIDNAQPKYTGDRQYYLTRIKLYPSNTLRMNITLEKDAGERWRNKNSLLPFDFFSASLLYQGNGNLSTVVVGDYLLQFGQGAAMSSGFSLGKSTDILNVARPHDALRMYSSTNELRFLRGVAARYILHKWSFTPFFSQKSLDASTTVLVEGGTEYVKTFQQTGYHRTMSELANRRRLVERTHGGAAVYNSDGLRAGGIVYRTGFSMPVSAGGEEYRRYYFNGQAVTLASAFYSFSLKNAYLFGEYSRSLASGTSWIQGVALAIGRKWSVVALGRNQSVDFHSFYSQPIKESSVLTGERGLFCGVDYKPSTKWTYSFYSDMYKFPWKRYRVSAASRGMECLMQARYSHSAGNMFTLRLRNKYWQENAAITDASAKKIAGVSRSNVRVEARYTLGKFQCGNRVEYCFYFKEYEGNSAGWMIYHDILYKAPKSRLDASMRISYFDTEDFDSGIYSVERNFMSVYGATLLHYKGLRAYFNSRIKISRNVVISFRYSRSHYLNRETVGSGNDLIDGNVRSDYRLQLSYKI